MNEITQGLEQVALTAESQAELAQKLNEIVGRLKILKLEYRFLNFIFIFISDNIF